MGTREDKDGKKMKRGWEQEKTKTGKWRNETGIGNVQRVETKGVGQTERSPDFVIAYPKNLRQRV